MVQIKFFHPLKESRKPLVLMFCSVGYSYEFFLKEIILEEIGSVDAFSIAKSYGGDYKFGKNVITSELYGYVSGTSKQDVWR